jgi:hypothetical protein
MKNHLLSIHMNAQAKTRSKTKTRAKKNTAPARGKVPPALAKRAHAAAEAKLARLRTEASALIALIVRRKRAISESFYDMGEALAKLQDKAMVRALGRRTFAEVCAKDCKLSVQTADRLVSIVKSMTRDEAIGLDAKKALALIDLAHATPEDDSAASLAATHALKLPSGRTIDPSSSTANELTHAAVQIRHAHQKKKPARGRTTTPEERAAAARLEKELHALGVRGATVTAVATKPGAPSNLRIERVPVGAMPLLAKAARAAS